MGDNEALKRLLRAARSQAGIESDVDLAARSGVHLQTLQNWMYGKTTPRPSELHKVARLLGVPLDNFMAAYEGRDPEPPPLQDAIRELVAELRALVAEMERGRAAQEGVLEGIERGLRVAASIPEVGVSEESNEPRSHGGSAPSHPGARSR